MILVKTKRLFSLMNSETCIAVKMRSITRIQLNY